MYSRLIEGGRDCVAIAAGTAPLAFVTTPSLATLMAILNFAMVFAFRLVEHRQRTRHNSEIATLREQLARATGAPPVPRRSIGFRGRN